MPSRSTLKLVGIDIVAYNKLKRVAAQKNITMGLCLGRLIIDELEEPVVRPDVE